MKEKKKLTERVVESFRESGYFTLRLYGCVDVIARKTETFIVKVLTNVDGLLEVHATTMKILSAAVDACPFVVSLKTNRGKLMDSIVYSRFNIPVITPNTLEMLLFEEKLPNTFTSRGKHLVRINFERMKRKRLKLGMTLSELAKITGLTIKAVYEIESGRVNPTLNSARKIEEALNEELILPGYTKPEVNFERVMP